MKEQKPSKRKKWIVPIHEILMRLSSSSFGYANGAGGAPVDGSISRRSVRGGARMKSGDLCKLASCVSGIQMALNLCLLCSPGQRRGVKKKKEERGESFCWQPQGLRVGKCVPLCSSLVMTHIEKCIVLFFYCKIRRDLQPRASFHANYKMTLKGWFKT